MARTTSRSSKGSSLKKASYPETLKRRGGRWVVDPDKEILRGIRGKRRDEGLRQAWKLARVVNFIESFLKIVTKAAKLEPFKLNSAQVVIVQLVAFCWVQLRPAQILVPKSRQMGVSTLLQALLFVLALLTKNYRCLTVAHREDSAGMIFRMSKKFEEHLPDEYRKKLKTKTKGCMEWEDSGSLTQVATIGTGDGLGMGFTLNALHGSEVAVWAKKGDAKGAWTSVSPAIADNKNTLIAFESTPDGPDPFFYDLCVKALVGFGDWEVAFLPWYMDDSYRISRREYRLRVKRARLEGDVDYTLTAEEEELGLLVAAQPCVAGEEWIRWPCTLDLEQLLWRRLTIENKCDGDVDTFNRFYPSTWEMAFQNREVNLFEPHTLERLQAQRRPPVDVGAMHEVMSQSQFVSRTTDQQKRAKWSVELWERPDSKCDYVLAADVAEGIDGADSSAAYVGKINRDLGQVEIVASIHGIVDPDLYAEQLDLLGQWYGDALLAVEINRTYEVMRTLRKRSYKNLYWRSDPTNPKSKTRQPGWHTNPKTRPIMLSILKAMARDNDLACPDAGLSEEMGDMVPGKGGRWEARKGKHDDRVMAMGILCAVAGFRDNRGRRRRDRSKDAVAARAEDNAVSTMERRRAWAKSKNQLRTSGDTSVTF